MITLKPWLVTIAFVLILRYTGALSGLSYFTQSAVMETGVMDAAAKPNVTKAEPFNYSFTVRDMKGNVVNMEDMKGKVLFLNLWATWCGPCRVEMPSIESLYSNVDKNEVAFIMLSLDTEQNFKKVVNYIEDKEFTFPVYVVDKGLTKQLQVPSIPTTFIIGKDGNIKRKEVGAANYDTPKFKRFLEELAKQP